MIASVVIMICLTCGIVDAAVTRVMSSLSDNVAIPSGLQVEQVIRIGNFTAIIINDSNTSKAMGSIRDASFSDPINNSRNSAWMLEENTLFTVTQSESLSRQKNPPSWALDRVDERQRINSQEYTYPSSAGENTFIYILDTGVDVTHRELFWDDSCELRAFAGPSFAGNDKPLHPHGTFVASCAAGLTVGTAKRAQLVSVQVLNNKGEGDLAGILQGLEWAVNDIKSNGRTKGRSVINMSLGAGRSGTLNRAVNAASDEGIPVVVAAGNSDFSACLESPSSASDAIAVGASTQNDEVASFSNRGTCVELFAPGESIYGAINSGQSEAVKANCKQASGSYTTEDGTSFSAPLVAGIVALYQAHERYVKVDHSNMSGSQYSKYMRDQITSQASRGKLKLGFFTTSPNRLAYSFPAGMNESNH